MTLVGVDAGGTGTRAVVVRDGAIQEHRALGPLNLLLHADAVDRLADLLTATGATAAGLGLAGLRSPGQADRLAAELAARTGAAVAVGDDTDAALAGAFRGGPGVVVIAGTGSGAAGQDADGRRERAGGHGFLLGDEGGGYWIGREAVRAALRAQDGTGPPTALTGVVRRAFRHLLEAERQVHERPTDRQLLARLVPAVAAAARSDREAARIVAEAAGHLVDLACAVDDRLGGGLPVAGVGGVFRCAAVRQAFTSATAAVEPAEPPELGALRLLDR